MTMKMINDSDEHWLSKVKIYHLLDELDNKEQRNEVLFDLFSRLGDLLSKAPEFNEFPYLAHFKNVKKIYDVVPPLFTVVEICIRLLDLMYDYADEHRIYLY